ncbi:uncharacterized protein PAC_12913 [Phialocephala subalpina]|uniref:2EXR domain-containing protein n=1 Tax=Phialocephala subalpina TaxID=576137 RepID=A0A1L7XDF0_9HELO|nr:uncharacterized protein PAC_12913 [Phialocephala subalpina]
MSAIPSDPSASDQIPDERTFTCFPKLPREIRLMIWEAALPGPRIVHIRHKSLQKTIGQWEQENNALWPAFNGEMVPIPDDYIIEQLYLSDERDSSDRHAAARFQVRDELYYSSIDFRAADDHRKAHLQGLASDLSTPQNLLACREAYEVVAKRYTRAFACPLSIPQTYFNFESDTLYLRYDTFTGSYKQTLPSEWAGLVLIGQTLDSGFGIEDTDNVRKVRRLAILLDEDEDELVREYQVMRDILCIFPCLEKLYLVVNHLVYGSENDIQHADMSALALIDPIDVEEAVRTWDAYDPSRETDRDNVRLPVIRGLDEDFSDYVGMDELKQWNQDNHEAGKDWVIPKLEFKLMVHESSKRLLEASKRLCEARIKSNLLDRELEELEKEKIMRAQQT